MEWNAWLEDLRLTQGFEIKINDNSEEMYVI